MDDLQELKKRRLEQIQRQYADQRQYSDNSGSQEQARMLQQAEQLEAIIKSKLSKEALQRYGNIKAADPEKAMRVLLALAQIIQSGRMESIDDTQFKRILAMMDPGKKDIKIVRK